MLSTIKGLMFSGEYCIEIVYYLTRHLLSSLNGWTVVSDNSYVAGEQCGMLVYMPILVELAVGEMIWNLLLTHSCFFSVAACLGKDIRFRISKFEWCYAYT